MLKKIYFFLLWMVLISQHVHSQAPSSAIGIHLSAIDLFGPQTGNYFFHENKNQNQRLYWDPVFQVSYWKSFSRHTDFKASVSLSSLLMPARTKDSIYTLARQQEPVSASKRPFASVNTGIVFSFLPKNRFIITPQAEAGIGYYFQSKNSGVIAHGGLGFNVCLSEHLNLLLNSAYQYSLSNKGQSYLQHSLGFLYRFGREMKVHEHISVKKEKVASIPETKKRKKEVSAIQTTPLVPAADLPDTDNDGIPDVEDGCINEPGKKEMKGCPDRDKDGVADKEDDCPDVKGSATAKGCPDSDGDGTEDENDKCPDEFGKGPDGCPKVEKGPIETDSTEMKDIKEESIKASQEKINAASGEILFNSGTAYIHPSTYFALDTIVSVLKKDISLSVDIEGHTDNTGNTEQNILLSQKRADACKEYLVNHGIAEDRISSIGYGSMKPVSDNNTPEGRKANRRTEFLLSVPQTH